MPEQEDLNKDPVSIIQEIEQQLEEILKRRKEDIERDLEEKISREKEDARRRMEQIDQEMVEDKESLGSYRDVLSQLETEKAEIKREIQEHLERAEDLQSEIESKAAQTVTELQAVRELNGRLEEITRDAGIKVDGLKKGLEEKYGIIPELPSSLDSEAMSERIEQELAKLNRIRELLESEIELNQTESTELNPEAEEPAAARISPPDEDEAAAEAKDEVVVEAESESVETAEDAAMVEAEAGYVPGEDETPESELEEQEVSAPSVPEDEAASGLEEDSADEAGEKETYGDLDRPEEPDGEPGGVASEEEGEISELQDVLRKHRKSEGSGPDGEVAYFENEDRLSLDVAYIIESISNRVEEAKQLYGKLSQTESPKEQFFIKQEIIQHQETLRKLMLSTLRMCERGPEFLPEFTSDIFNVDTLRTILEKVSMENWSNQDDFSSFDEYTSRLKVAFEEKTSPPRKYLESIAEALRIGL